MYLTEFENDDALITVFVSRLDWRDSYGVWVLKNTPNQGYRMVTTEEGQFSWVRHPELEVADPFVVFPGPIFRGLVKALRNDTEDNVAEEATAKALAAAIEWSQVRG